MTFEDNSPPLHQRGSDFDIVTFCEMYQELDKVFMGYVQTDDKDNLLRYVESKVVFDKMVQDYLDEYQDDIFEFKGANLDEPQQYFVSVQKANQCSNKLQNGICLELFKLNHRLFEDLEALKQSVESMVEVQNAAYPKCKPESVMVSFPNETFCGHIETGSNFMTMSIIPVKKEVSDV
jgi:hypothetical protein